MTLLARLLRAACFGVSLLATALTAAQTAASGEGVAFGSSLSAARKAAEASGKPILIDAMTTWCAPCRLMDQQVFSEPAVGAYVNANFEPVKLDMERGEGLIVGSSYGVRGYPTILIIDPEGRELDRQLGYTDLAGFIEFVHGVVEATASRGGAVDGSFAALDEGFREGRRDTAELRALVDFAERADHPRAAEYVDALLTTLDDYDSPWAVDLVLRHAAVDNRLFDELVARQASYAETVGEYEVASTLARALDAGLFPGEQAVKPRRARRLIARAFPGAEAAADSTYIRFRMRRAREAGKAKRYGRWAIKWEERYPTADADELDELVYIFEERLPGWREDVVAEWRRRREEALAEEF